jgi:DNA ligase 1
MNNFQLMLAKPYDPSANYTGWWMSEKKDGLRACWTGKDFVSRNNKIFNAPEWFKNQLPKNIVLDGELFTKRNNFNETVSIVKKKIPVDSEWKKITFNVFDMPRVKKPFEQRMQLLKALVSPTSSNKTPLRIVEQTPVQSTKDLLNKHRRAVAQGAEGTMLRKPGSLYEQKRSSTLLKVKDVLDEDAMVTGWEAGKGKYTGMLGNLQVVWVSGKHVGIPFKVGSGLTDVQRKAYKTEFPTGTIVRIQFFEYTLKGKPRFPVLKGIHVNR